MDDIIVLTVQNRQTDSIKIIEAKSLAMKSYFSALMDRQRNSVLESRHRHVVNSIVLPYICVPDIASPADTEIICQTNQLYRRVNLFIQCSGFSLL